MTWYKQRKHKESTPKNPKQQSTDVLFCAFCRGIVSGHIPSHQMDLNMDITNRLQTRIPRHFWQPVRYFWGNHASDWPQTGHFIEFQSILIWSKVDLRDLPGRWCQPWGSTISTCCMPFRCVCSPLRSVGCGAQTRPYMRGFAAAAPFRVSEKRSSADEFCSWMIDRYRIRILPGIKENKDP